MAHSSKSLKRRRFLQLSATSAAAILVGSATSGKTHQQNQYSLRTKLCEVLNIEFPIIQAGMGGVASPELAAKVSEAGGLGIITGTFLQPDELLKRIRRVRELTSKPFGVNLMLHNDMINPIDIAKVPKELVKKAQEHLNKYRKELNIPEQTELTLPVPDLLKEEFEIIIKEKVPVWSIGLGKPTKIQVEQCRKNGIKIIAMIATVEDAREVSESGVDVIVAQGSEAGGHRSTWTKKDTREHSSIGTFTLVPQVVDAVSQPVVAAGGINDGRGLIAALALGATGVLIGTRFIACKESSASDIHKQAVIDANSDNTTITDKCSGAYARVIRNKFTNDFEKDNGAMLPPWVHMLAARDIYRAAIEQKRPEYYSLWAGQGVGQIKSIPSADEIVRSIINEATQVTSFLGKK